MARNESMRRLQTMKRETTMKPTILKTLSLAALVAALGCLCGCASSTAGTPKLAASTAVAPPALICVTDFYLAPGDIQKHELVPRNHIVGSRLGRLRNDDPAAKAQKLIRVLSETIVHDLNEAGLRAEYRPNRAGLRSEFIPADLSFPKAGWVVGGWFAKVDEGNRALNATVGFGKGAGQVEIEVTVSDLARNMAEPFLFIGSASAAKMRPGGLVMMNPYVMAAKFVMSKGATEKDVKQQGSAIAVSLVHYVNTGSPTTPQP